MPVDRRTLLTYALSGLLAHVAPVGASPTRIEAGSKWLQFFSDENGPASPQLRGALEGADALLLLRYARDVAAVCGWEESFANYAPRLSSDLNLKTTEAPSYLSEYRSAARVLAAAYEALPDAASTVTHVLFADYGHSLENTVLGRARKYVFAEILTHLVSQIGFRSFGSINYRGYIAGPVNAPGSFRHARRTR